MKLGFRAEFDPMLLSWSGPDERPTEECAICEAPLADVGLIMWRDDGWTVRLCGACVRRWLVVVE